MYMLSNLREPVATRAAAAVPLLGVNALGEFRLPADNSKNSTWILQYQETLN
jgi:hypothetical protein